VQFARGVNDGKDYAIKFFTAREAFEREDALYSNKVLRDMMPAVKMIEANADGRIRSRSGWPFPPCIVIERGESLDKWAERLRPDFPTILQARAPHWPPPSLRTLPVALPRSLLCIGRARTRTVHGRCARGSRRHRHRQMGGRALGLRCRCCAT
jgi:hypothetical protein